MAKQNTGRAIPSYDIKLIPCNIGSINLKTIDYTPDSWADGFFLRGINLAASVATPAGTGVLAHRE